jgi:riboflavin biosynthesis pyrimidine reductase
VPAACPVTDRSRYGPPVAAPTLDLLLPTDRAGVVAPDPEETELLTLYAMPSGVRANMVTTLDGAATGADGRSGSINDSADHRVFAVLRALADVVLVGAGTVRTEGYGSLRTSDALVAGRRARGQDDHPALAVVTRRGDLPLTVLRGEPGPWVFTVADAPFLGHLRAHLPKGRLHVHADHVDLRRTVDDLQAAGLGHVLTEGGPGLLGTLAAEDLLDDLCLTQTPLVVGGDAGRVLRAPALDARRRDLVHLLHAQGTLLGRWRLRPR